VSGTEDLPGERWTPVPGFGGLYEVSDMGRVKSLERRCATGHGSTRRVREPLTGEVAHVKDGDPVNLRLDNLEWSTYEKIRRQKPNGGYESLDKKGDRRRLK
jgi:hypothetical protein